MSFAVNYHRWILARLKPFLGSRIVEVGAGRGAFSELLLETGPEALTVLEPSANMYPLLLEKLAAIDKERVAQARQCTLAQASVNFAEAFPLPDSVLYINVLEHIEDDEAELRAAHALLTAGGHVLIFVPANRWLTGSIDRQLGHFRRYTMDELRIKCRSAGFRIRLAVHFDFFGIAPWWLKFCVLKSDRLTPGAVRLYDRCVVPFARMLERAIPPPIGKNVIVAGEKLA